MVREWCREQEERWEQRCGRCSACSGRKRARHNVSWSTVSQGTRITGQASKVEVVESGHSALLRWMRSASFLRPWLPALAIPGLSFLCSLLLPSSRLFASGSMPASLAVALRQVSGSDRHQPASCRCELPLSHRTDVRNNNQRGLLLTITCRWTLPHRAPSLTVRLPVDRVLTCIPGCSNAPL